MFVRLHFYAGFVLLILIIAGCSGGNSPVSAPVDQPLTTKLNHEAASDSFKTLWGFYDVTIDGSTGYVDVTPVRGLMFNANVTKFLQPPSAPINLLAINLNPGSELQFGYLDLTVSIRHPFIGVDKFRGFDVRGIVMGEGSTSFDYDPSGIRFSEGDLELLNPDGFTRWWNPTEFTTYNTIFGYTDGAFATPSFDSTTTVNAYKYFSDSLESESPLETIDIDSRGTFGTDPGINLRTYLLQFPTMPGGGPVYHFSYAIDASWALPSENFAPDYPVEAYPKEANAQEAWNVSVSDSESTAYYIDPDHKGGTLDLAIEVYDWQARFGPSTVADEVSAIWLESPVLNTPTDINPTAVISDGGPVSSVWNVEVSDLNLMSAGMFDLWVMVESSDPDNYGPVIDGDPGMFDWPDAPLTAYFRRSVHIDGEFPDPAPIVLDVVPSFGAVSTIVDDLQIFGENFNPGATVEFVNDSSESLVLTEVTWLSSSLITCDVDCNASLGFYDVTVTNPDTQYCTLDDGFEIIDVFECSGSAHDWEGYDHPITNGGDLHLRMDLAVMKSGPYAGQMLYQTTSSTWALVDPDGGPQSAVDFITTPSMLLMDVETCETTGRIAFLSQFNARILYLYDDEGSELGNFSDPNLDPDNGYFTCMDFDQFGDLWIATKTIIDADNSVFELRHYELLEDDPWYSPVTEDTVDITTNAMTGPNSGRGVGDIGICFYLNRLYVITANTSDGGTNRLSAWDLNPTPPEFLNDIQNPYPPLTRHHIYGGTGSLGRMNVDADHRFDNDIEEQCRIYTYATIWTNTPSSGLDCYVQRYDGDLNLLDTGEPWYVAFPADFDYVPQCAVINDYDASSSANLLGVHWAGPTLVDWPVPADW